MTRTSFRILLAISLISGCTSDPMGLRSPYRGRVVPPSANQPYTNAPVAMQPGSPLAMNQAVVLPQSPIANMALAQRSQAASPYPMLASAGGQFDGRAFPLLTREAQLPHAGGARSQPRAFSTVSTASTTSRVGSLPSTPQEDLRYRGGRTIKDLKYMNIYVGGSAAWDANDWKNIDKALAAAMADTRLNNVVVQYFNNQPVSSQFLGSFFLNGWNPKTVQKTDLAAQVQSLYRQHAFDGRDLQNTVVNFMLPRGTILGDPNGGQQVALSNKAIPMEEAEDSTGGLGGYHGSTHIDGKTIYYAVGVYSERQSNGQTNGIPVFNANWKNMVATMFHELHEARTDPDVDDAITSPNGMNLLGWTSDSGQEIGDYPIAEATQLLQVFVEVPLADGSGTVPIQLLYSNAVHGPEGPIDYPHGMEPAPGTVPPSNPPTNPPPTNNPSSSTLPPEVNRMINNWDQLEDYVKKAILKLLS